MASIVRPLAFRGCHIHPSMHFRRTLQSEAKQAREALRNQNAKMTSNSPISKGWLAIYGSVAGVSAFTWAVTSDGELGSSVRNSYAWRWVQAQVGEISKPFSEPNREKLLPDWPYFPNVPPGTPCPPTLVLDLEGTLCTSVWDHKYGWRHVKRPGVEKFLKEMARYYELVVFSPNIGGIADPIITALDKDGVVIHRLYREATKFVNGAHVKDLSALNRDLRKVIVLDDDARAFQLQPNNAIHVPPFKDPRDKGDSVLEDLTPFLQAIVNEGVKDVPALIRSFHSNEATEVSSMYNSKLSSVKDSKDFAMSRGLGGALRTFSENSAQNRTEAKDSFKIEKSEGSMVSRVVRPSEESKAALVPLASERKGGLWKRLDSLKEEADAVNRKKMEAFHEVMMKKDMAKRDD